MLIADCWFVEGEKAVGALQNLLPDHPILCWQGGSQAVSKSDYSSLQDRDCVIFPDNDLAGKKAANDLMKQLTAAGARSVRVLDVEKLALNPGWQGQGETRTATLNDSEPLPVGDDAAELVVRSWKSEHFSLLLKRKDIFVSTDTKETKPASQHEG